MEPTEEFKFRENGNNMYKCVQTFGNIGPHQYVIWTIECNMYPWHIIEWGDLPINGDIHDEKDIENGKSWMSSFDSGDQMAARDLSYNGGGNIEGFEEIVDSLDLLLLEYNNKDAHV